MYVDSAAWVLAPLIRCDSREPFMPSLVAVTVTYPDDDLVSASSGTQHELLGDVVCEYAVWWDAEIGHVYELEHVWVHGKKEQDGSWVVVGVEGSAHGGRVSFDVWEMRNGRPVVYSEPGKHGMSKDGNSLPRDIVEWLCGPEAGRDGVHNGGHYYTDKVDDHRRAFHSLANMGFVPAWDATLQIDTRDVEWCDWKQLQTAMPVRVKNYLAVFPTGRMHRVAGGWEDTDKPLIVVQQTHYLQGSGWWVDGLPWRDRVHQMREMKRSALIPVEETVTIEQMRELRQVAWDDYCSSMLTIVCPESVADRVRSVGILVAVDRGCEGPVEGDDWIVAHTVEETEMFGRTCRVIGPGDADIII